MKQWKLKNQSEKWSKLYFRWNQECAHRSPIYINIFSTPPPPYERGLYPLSCSPPLTPSTPVHAFDVRMNYKYQATPPWLVLMTVHFCIAKEVDLSWLSDSSCCVSLPRGAMHWSVIVAFLVILTYFCYQCIDLSTKINDGSSLLSVWMCRWTFSFSCCWTGCK